MWYNTYIPLPLSPGIAMTTCDSLERSTGKYVQPLTYYVHHDDSRQALLTRQDSSHYQSLQTKNMNYISIYSIPTESSSSRQVTPSNSLSGERTYANNDEVSIQQVQPRSGVMTLAQVDHRYQGSHHQDNEEVPYTSLDLRQREYSQMYTTPQNNPGKH